MIYRPEKGGSILLRNFGTYLRKYRLSIP